MLPNTEGLSRQQITIVHDGYVDAALAMVTRYADLKLEVRSDLVDIERTLQPTPRSEAPIVEHAQIGRQLAEPQLRMLGKISAILSQEGRPPSRYNKNAYDA